MIPILAMFGLFASAFLVGMFFGEIVLLTLVVLLTGQSCCLKSLPDAIDNKLLIYSVVLQVLGVVYSFGFRTFCWFFSEKYEYLRFELLNIPAFLSQILFILFLIQLVRYLDRRDLQSRGWRLLVTEAILLTFLVLVLLNAVWQILPSYILLAPILLILICAVYARYAGGVANAIRSANQEWDSEISDSAP